jgi:hypothetical protein
MAKEIERLIVELAQRRGFAAPRPDEVGCYFLLLDGSLEVRLFQTGDTLLLEAQVGPIPSDDENAEEVLVRVLRRQLARSGNKAESLSLDPESGDLILYRALPARLTALADLQKAIGDFANALEYWSKQLAGTPPAPGYAPPRATMLFP